MRSPDKVTRYTEKNLKIYFPDDMVCCDLCPVLETYSRKQCRATGEYLVNTKSVGYWCPLLFGENQNKIFKENE